MIFDRSLSRTLARSLLLGALAAALGACVSSAGIEHQGALKALPAGPAETAPTVWPTDRWWLAYGAPELDQLIDHALADSPDIERARARLRLAQAGSEFATARSFPEVDLNFKSTIQRYAEYGLAPRAVAGEHRSDNRFALDFTYELDLFGKNAAIAKSVEVQAASMETDLYTARVGLASAVARSWFALGEALAEREVIDATLAQRQRILALVRARVAEGLDSKVEERQAEGAIPAAVGELAAVDERIALLRSVLAKLAVVPLETTAKLKPALKGAGLASLPRLLPSGLYKFANGGVLGWGTICGALNGAIAVIGGNVANTVGRRFFPIDADGRLAAADPPWLAVLRVGPRPVTVAWFGTPKALARASRWRVWRASCSAIHAWRTPPW